MTGEVTSGKRLSELDWLRVILIFAVFLHHVLMPFNGDGWHIQNAESSKLLDDIMVYFEQLRLPTLFFIAGAGSVLLLRKISGMKFLGDKFLRLFVPLIVGILFIVPPQSYVESIERYASYWAAYPELALRFSANHLWFIEYLIVFFVLALPLAGLFKSKFGSQLSDAVRRLSGKRFGLLSLAIVLATLRVVLKNYFPEDDHAIENLSSSVFYLFFFAAGMLFMQRTEIWSSLAKHRRVSLYSLVACSVLFYGYYFSPDLSGVLSLKQRWAIWWLVCSLVSWTAMLTMLGYAQEYLTTTPAWLKTCNELAYPFYILHQTVIVVLAYFVVSFTWALPMKIGVLLVASLAIIVALCWLVVRPFNIFRVLFGLRRHKVRDRS